MVYATSAGLANEHTFLFVSFCIFFSKAKACKCRQSLKIHMVKYSPKATFLLGY